MSVVDDLVSAGYYGYQGWDPAAAMADFNATGGAGKGGGEGGGSGSGSIPAFNFDYEGEAKKAYGELGPYYTRLLDWAQGDMNKVLARLKEDYDSGLRFKKEDTAYNKQTLTNAQGQQDIQEGYAKENVTNNALARGLYQRSLDDLNRNPEQGFGIPDQQFNKVSAAYDFRTGERNRQMGQLDTNLTRYEQQATSNKTRTEQDQATNFERDKFKLEEERKTRSADLANTRGQKAYNDYIAKFSMG